MSVKHIKFEPVDLEGYIPTILTDEEREYTKRMGEFLSGNKGQSMKSIEEREAEIFRLIRKRYGIQKWVWLIFALSALALLIWGSK